MLLQHVVSWTKHSRHQNLGRSRRHPFAEVPMSGVWVGSGGGGLRKLVGMRQFQVAGVPSRVVRRTSRSTIVGHMAILRRVVCRSGRVRRVR